MRLRIALLALAAFWVASLAAAQIRTGTVEISPFAGYLFGGKFERGTTPLFDTTVDVDDHATYGVRLGYNINSKFEVELQGSRTETAFVTHDHDGGGLFGDSSTQKLGDLDIDYYLASLVFNFGHRRVVPYVSLGAGAARLSPRVPDTPASREYRATATLGAGVKVFINPHFGLRFDGRYYGTSIGNNDRRDHCDRSSDRCDDNRDWLSNGDLTGGLVFAF